jgi:hypothetical protein
MFPPLVSEVLHPYDSTTQGAPSGFMACARALLGEAGRAGRVNAAVGVMQVRISVLRHVTVLFHSQLCQLMRQGAR